MGTNVLAWIESVDIGQFVSAITLLVLGTTTALTLAAEKIGKAWVEHKKRVDEAMAGTLQYQNEVLKRDLEELRDKDVAKDELITTIREQLREFKEWHDRSARETEKLRADNQRLKNYIYGIEGKLEKIEVKAEATSQMVQGMSDSGLMPSVRPVPPSPQTGHELT